jgi:catechol 2,3-dioxygenase-like lactoylglutathione lyase family enzyme
MHLRYTGLRVKNLSRSLRFYTKVLGLRVVTRGDLSEYGAGIWVLVEDPRSHQRIELNWYPPSSPWASRFQAGDALDHVGFLVGNVSRSRFSVRTATYCQWKTSVATTTRAPLAAGIPPTGWSVDRARSRPRCSCVSSTSFAELLERRHSGAFQLLSNQVQAIR